MSVFTKVSRPARARRSGAWPSSSRRSTRSSPRCRRSPTTRWRTRRSSSGSAWTSGETLDDLLVEAFAVVREAAWRVLGQRHFDVQLMGGMALHFGWIAEMKTGEGKTLVSTLPVYLNALDRAGRARRDGQRLPGHPRRRVDGPAPPFLGPHRRPASAPTSTTR